MPRLATTLSVLTCTALFAAGCGGSDSASDDGASPAKPAAAKTADFPDGKGLTYDRVKKEHGATLALAPGSGILTKGTNRVPFLVLDEEAGPVFGNPVAVYAMDDDGTNVRGPFAAREQPFGISPAYVSRTTSSDPDQTKAFFVANVETERAGPTAFFALVEVDGKLTATSPTSIGIKPSGGTPPDVGDRAISMQTLTPADVGGDVSKLTTRVPPAEELVSTDFADVLGKKPVVLIFATPALCQSRVCGPDVDVAAQVQAETGDDFAWIQQEIFEDDDPNKGLRPQVAKWRLETEPWLFVIGRDGRVKARVEGAISVAEMRDLVREHRDA